MSGRILSGQKRENVAIWKQSALIKKAVFAASISSFSYYQHLLAASTDHVTCNQNTAIMCYLITLSPTCGNVDRLHLSERCHDAGAKICVMMLCPAGRGRQMHRRPSADASNHQSLPHYAYNL